MARASKHYDSLAAAQDYKCAYCGERVYKQGEVESTDYHHLGTIDHITPRSKGGTNAKTNLVVACSSCNFKWANRTKPRAVKRLLKKFGRCDPPKIPLAP